MNGARRFHSPKCSSCNLGAYEGRQESYLKHEQEDKNKQAGHQTKKLLHSQKKKINKVRR